MKLKLFFILLSIIFILGSLFLIKTIPNFISTQNASREVVLENHKESNVSEPELPKITIESIFSEQAHDLKNLDKAKIIRLLATGDVIPARDVNWKMTKLADFDYPFEKTANFLKKADMTLINLEAPLIKNCPIFRSGFTFCGNQRFINGLNLAGVDVVSIANNHIGNFGQDGIEQTKRILTKNGVEYTGFGKLVVLEIKGVKFGFLAYNGIGRKIDREALKAEIAESKKKVDVLIPSIHWGKEYELTPKADGDIAPDNPVEISHLMIDAGADLIIGNHPHTVQGVEIYSGKLITYAHGNFIFDQTWSQETQEGVVGEYTFYGTQLIDVQFHPILIDVSYQPQLLSEKDAQPVLNRMLKSTNIIAGRN